MQQIISNQQQMLNRITGRSTTPVVDVVNDVLKSVSNTALMVSNTMGVAAIKTSHMQFESALECQELIDAAILKYSVKDA
jgi:hypothetical protein